MKRIINIAWLAIAAIIIMYVIYKIAMNSFTNHFIGSNPQKIKAVIINHRNYEPNQPVKAEFTYSYQFEINGEKYTGNSHDISLKVGDSIEVKYNQDHPSINKPLKSKE